MQLTRAATLPLPRCSRPAPSTGPPPRCRSTPKLRRPAPTALSAPPATPSMSTRPGPPTAPSSRSSPSASTGTRRPRSSDHVLRASRIFSAHGTCSQRGHAAPQSRRGGRSGSHHMCVHLPRREGASGGHAIFTGDSRFASISPHCTQQPAITIAINILILSIGRHAPQAASRTGT